MNPGDLLDYDGAARLLGLSPGTVDQYAKSGRIPSQVIDYRYGRFRRRKRMFRVEDLLQYRERHWAEGAGGRHGA